MYVDQFGATTAVTNNGELLYEQDVIDFAEAHGWHWARWSYNVGSKQREIVNSPEVRAFYETNLPALLQRDHEPMIELLTNDAVRLIWAGRVLQTSTNLGDWSDVPAAPSPLETNTAGTAQRFWRLRVP